jgi:hypothetical protein
MKIARTEVGDNDQYEWSDDYPRLIPNDPASPNLADE